MTPKKSFVITTKSLSLTTKSIVLTKSFFASSASSVAPKILGLKLCTKDCSALISEVEAYEGENDEASHAHKITPRSKIMFDTYAHWYVYFIYGNHYCLNITCGVGEAGAVLIRGAIPIKGIGLMKKRRLGGKKGLISKEVEMGGVLKSEKGASKRKKKLSVEGIGVNELCNGPGKLCAAFGIDKSFNGLKLGEKLWLAKPNKKELKMLDKCGVCKFTRIGVTKAKHLDWRYKLVEK